MGPPMAVGQATYEWISNLLRSRRAENYRQPWAGRAVGMILVSIVKDLPLGILVPTTYLSICSGSRMWCKVSVFPIEPSFAGAGTTLGTRQTTFLRSIRSRTIVLQTWWRTRRIWCCNVVTHDKSTLLSTTNEWRKSRQQGDPQGWALKQLLQYKNRRKDDL